MSSKVPMTERINDNLPSIQHVHQTMHAPQTPMTPMTPDPQILPTLQ